MLFSKPSKAIGIDVGTHSVKAVLMTQSGGRYRVEHVGFAPVDPARMNVDPVEAQADAMRTALAAMPVHKSLVVGALPSQTVVIRYPRLPDMDSNQLQRAIEEEARTNLPFEVSEVFVDWTVLERRVDGDDTFLKVLLVAAKHELIDTRVQIASAADVEYAIMTVDSIALADAAEACDFLPDEQTVALINIGSASTSIHFVKDKVSNFYRDVNWGSRELVQAIAKARHVDTPAAEELLHEASRPSILPPEPVAPQPPLNAPPLPNGLPPAEPPSFEESLAESGFMGDMSRNRTDAPVSGLAPQSALSPGDLPPLGDDLGATGLAALDEDGPDLPNARFDLDDAIPELDMLDLGGAIGGATQERTKPQGKAPSYQDPLEANIGSGGGLDPLETHLGGLDMEQLESDLSVPRGKPTTALGMINEQAPLEDVLKMPLAKLVNELRRSFDFYEQQLYEQQIDRVIVSGGVAHIPMVLNTLRDELGFEAIEMANPVESALTLGRDFDVEPLLSQPAQFMVAIGLAARGASEL